MRGCTQGLFSWLGVGCVVVLGALASCGGGGGDKDEDKDTEGGPDQDTVKACLACAGAKCPSETKACDANENCKALRACELACDDTACQNQCVSSVASDGAAVIAAANLLACATTACDACGNASVPSTPGGSTGGRPGAGVGGAANGGTGLATSTGGRATGGTPPVSGTGGAPGRPPICQSLLEWAVGCVVDSDPEIRACDATNLAQCKASCYVGARCEDYDEAKAGVTNDVSVCRTACDIAYGGGSTTEPTCPNALGKWELCDIGGQEEICMDATDEDRCINQCVLTYDCNVVRQAIVNGTRNAFSDCLDNCEATSGEPNPNFLVSEGGYITTLEWHGYAWTWADDKGSTISPADFSALPENGKLCASGTVAGTADYSASAMIGVTLSQEVGDDMDTKGVWNPSGDGVYFNITNTGGTPLRIQIQAPGGDTDPSKRWCADVVGQAGEIFWHTFNTECWEGGLGVAYDEVSSLESISVLVPGDVNPRPFNFCVYELRRDD